MEKLYIESKPEYIDYLRLIGVDMSYFDSWVSAGYKPTFIGNHRYVPARGHFVGLSCVAHECDGGYIDNGYRKSLPNEFFGSLGGERIPGGF